MTFLRGSQEALYVLGMKKKLVNALFSVAFNSLNMNGRPTMCKKLCEALGDTKMYMFLTHHHLAV